VKVGHPQHEGFRKTRVKKVTIHNSQSTMATNGTMSNSYAARSARAHAGGGPSSGSSVASSVTMASHQQPSAARPHSVASVGAVQASNTEAQQAQLLTDATRRVQEHAYYMRQAMDSDDLPVVLDRAAHMLGELSDQHHAPQPQGGVGPPASASKKKPVLNPKNYYELHMRALDEMPNLEEYMISVTSNAGAPPSASSSKPTHTMVSLYEAVQYFPRAVPRLYLQICAGSALVRSGEVFPRTILADLIGAVKCVQSPLRGLFLRHYLLQAFRDKLPDVVLPPLEDDTDHPVEQLISLPEDGPTEGNPSLIGMGIVMDDPDKKKKKKAHEEAKKKGTVVDAYNFVLSNFIEMNKLWVRIQHMPGEGKSRENRKRREKERNELRILVGTNLVRLSQLEGVTCEIYGKTILPQIIEQIIACRDALAQAYLTDCIIQVFPDEFHVETLSTFLTICPKLREKVNIRTILQSMMDRLTNYYADELLLDGDEQKEVKDAIPVDVFDQFDNCVRSVYKTRGDHMPSREVVRLQTAVLNFSLKCYPGNMEQMNNCLAICEAFLRRTTNAKMKQYQQKQQNGKGEGTALILQMPGHDNTPASSKPLSFWLDEAAIDALEKLLSIPLESLALKVLELDHYSSLLMFLPWENRRHVSIIMLKALGDSGQALQDIDLIQELFAIIAPLLRDEDKGNDDGMKDDSSFMSGNHSELFGGASVASMSIADQSEIQGGRNNVPIIHLHEEQHLVAKLVHLLHHDDTDINFEMLTVARSHLSSGGPERLAYTMVPLAFAALRLLRRVLQLEFPATVQDNGDESGDAPAFAKSTE
jgi:vacuolar protein sorting-associated protein 35